jgi:hypothetical protein
MNAPCAAAMNPKASRERDPLTLPRSELDAVQPAGHLEIAPESVFEFGPFVRTARWLPVVHSRVSGAPRRALMALLIAWLPLAVLAAVQAWMLDDPRGRTFLLDYGAHSRFLLALPLLVYAPAVTLPKLGFVVRRFVETAAVPEREFPRLDAAISDTVRSLQSPVAELTLVAVAYGIVLARALSGEQDLTAWRELGLPVGDAPSLSGYWYLLVSAPLLVVVVLGWIRRQFLWGRLMRGISQLDLELVPSHPDRLGGLGFVRACQKGYWPISVALGLVMGGAMTNAFVHAGISPLRFQVEVGFLILMLFVLVGAPLLPLCGPLRRAKKRGLNEYGHLAARVGRKFEQTWVAPVARVDADALKAADFSATIDLYQVVSNVNSMRKLPFTTKDLLTVALPALAPLVPIAFMILPRERMLEQLKKIVNLIL